MVSKVKGKSKADPLAKYRNEKGQWIGRPEGSGAKPGLKERVTCIWRAALMRAEREGFDSVEAWLASPKVSQTDFMVLLRAIIPRDVKIEADVTVTYESWLDGLRSRAAEARRQLAAEEQASLPAGGVRHG